MRKTNNRELLAASGINALLNVFTKLPQAKAEFCDLPVGDHGHNFRLLGNADPKPNGDDLESEPLIAQMQKLAKLHLAKLPPLANPVSKNPEFQDQGQVQDDQFFKWFEETPEKPGYNSLAFQEGLQDWFRFEFNDDNLTVLLYEMKFQRLFRGSRSGLFSEIIFKKEEERNKLHLRMIEKGLQNDALGVRY
eukprot:GHVP01050717.1.p1 GENE.GHVP01050717.1~~GHVP01050717.1.p1  ORF type:complete len:192 (-),score=33.27 GHVP01050717.1:94-669(-)